MANMTRGERTVQLFAKVISNPDKRFTINDLMLAFEIPEGERRNEQRDMRFLSEMDGERYIAVENEGRTAIYRSALRNAEQLLFPNFENAMLHFCFSQTDCKYLFCDKRNHYATFGTHREKSARQRAEFASPIRR